MKIALLFPGYSSQFVGMGKELYDEFRIVQEYFDEASQCLDINFLKLCFASSDVELSKMGNAYTSLFVIGCAIFALLKEQGIEPDLIAGYNNGEHAALFSAGCFSFPDGLYLLHKFCSFYEEALAAREVNAMHARGIAVKQLEDSCNALSDDAGKIFIALYNGPTDCVVAGDQDKIFELRDMIMQEPGIIINEVSPYVGLHSELMNGVSDQFKIYLEKVDFKDLRIPLMSGIDGHLVTQGQECKERFIQHINSAMHFESVLRGLVEYDLIIIAVPSEVLGALIKRQYPEKRVVLISKKADIEALKEMVTVSVKE